MIRARFIRFTTPWDRTHPTPDTSIPTFALYPLIISAGYDKAYGVIDDGATTGGAKNVRYADATAVALNPFIVLNKPMTEPFGRMLGSVPDKVAPSNGWYKGCDQDNITNHQLGTR